LRNNDDDNVIDRQLLTRPLLRTISLRRLGILEPTSPGGSALAQVWFSKGVPVVEYQPDDLFEKIRPGDHVMVDGASGEIRVGMESAERWSGG
jgi:hypothetical protein